MGLTDFLQIDKLGLVKEMNKKTVETPIETIKLTVSEVKPEESLPENPPVGPEETVVSDPSSVVDDLYSGSDKVVEAQKPKKSPKGGFWGFVGGLLIGGLVTGGIFGFIINPKDAENRPEVSEVISSPTPVAEVTPEVTEKPKEVDYSQYTVKILNGSGVAGAAAGIEGLIEDLDFENIETGNASVSGQKETTVQLKKNIPQAVFEKLKELLAKYNVVTGDSLQDSAGSDVQITVGAKKEE